MTAAQPSPADPPAAAPASPASASPAVTESDLPATAWHLMRQFVDAHAIKPELRERLGLGAGSGRVKVLFLLRQQPLTLAQLAEAHGVDRPYATIIVDRLEELGFVERTPHPSDRRSKVVSLTPAGWDAVALADQILGEPPAALRELNTAQLTDLVGLLSRLSLAPRAPRGSVGTESGRRRT